MPTRPRSPFAAKLQSGTPCARLLRGRIVVANARVPRRVIVTGLLILSIGIVALAFSEQLSAQQPDGQPNEGAPGPSAPGVWVDPQRLPTAEPVAPSQGVQDIPRRYPTSGPSIEDLKDEANAAANATATATADGQNGGGAP